MTSGLPYRLIGRSRRWRARGSSLVRTLVVACATLAILLVCFSIYQYSQRGPEDSAGTVPRRLPDVTTSLHDAFDSRTADDAAVDIGPAKVGGGEKARLTLYRAGQDTAWGEIEIEDYSRVAQSSNEFLMIAPEFRMRTPDGHAVRVTSEQCIVEGELGVGLKISRGRLIGHVLIEYDRLTKEQRDQRAASGHQGIDPKDLVRIEAPQMWFDVEYSKLTAPEELHVDASDIQFDAQDMEVRFDEQAGQIDYLHVAGGGSLELRSPDADLTGGGAFDDEPARQRLTLSVWLRETFQQFVLAQGAGAVSSVRAETSTTGTAASKPNPAETANEKPSESTPEVDEHGIPIFQIGPKSSPRKAKAPAVRYVARFEGQVDAQQRSGDTIKSHLEAEVLDIIRSFGEGDRRRLEGGPSDGGTKTQSTDTSTESPAVTRLTWTRRLSVQACSAADPRCANDRKTLIVATGSPVRMVSPQGRGVCQEVQFNPETSAVAMTGSATAPAKLASTAEGVIVGRKITTQRREAGLEIVVEGPGSLRRKPPVHSADGSAPSPNPFGPAQQTSIDFQDQLRATVHYSTTTVLDFTQGLVTQRRRHLEQASFTGEVKLRDRDLQLDADHMTVAFAPADRSSSDKPLIEQVLCRGHVRMRRSQDRVRCGELDVRFAQTQDGTMFPLRAVARSQVEAVQDRRILRAADELIVDFEKVEGALPRVEARHADVTVAQAGTRSGGAKQESQHRQDEGRTRVEVGVKSMSARGNVTIDDPDQRLEVSADHFVCTLVDGRTIDKADVWGQPGIPATVRLEDKEISGLQIKFSAEDDTAHVPGAGRMSFLLQKDLNGQRLDNPTPISVTWSQQMRYQGRENRVLFKGAVHAASAADTTFDCNKLLIEFDDVPQAPIQGRRDVFAGWWPMEKILALMPGEKDNAARSAKRLAKEPAYILATGKARVQIVGRDDVTGEMTTRSVLAGPQLSINLRRDVTKMLIEGPGYLQLEDHRQAPSQPSAAVQPAVPGLLSTGQGGGPSLTLIEWKEFMSYDFSIAQTRFEGQVNLKHFAGQELVDRFGSAAPKTSQRQAGRATFLNCDTLTADFRTDVGARQARQEQQVGNLSASKLRQFHASGHVTLQDQVEGIALTATDLTFERERKVLVIQGTELTQAHIVLQRTGRFPLELSTRRAFYNLADKTIESEGTSIRGQ